MVIRIPSPLWSDLRQHGEETYPHECCGVLIGEHGDGGANTVAKVVRCGNTRSDSPQNRYNIAPAEIAKIQREAMLTSLDIVGFYHSHPDHLAKWSSTDLLEAHWMECSYVITSVENGRAVLTNSFRLLGAEDNKWFEDESIEIAE